ncbi:GlyGly-CTERM sorting domain-containing protein [Hydrogenophaga sp. UC242_53]|uniref:GlyGly-CTERM sorting domain-containing protein n=1 Tax=Hydrogenophaga sp. UC242_53 TaxID=3350170 RepID=UPI0036D33E79
MSVAPVQAGTWTYTLTCRPQSPNHANVSAFITVNAAPAVTQPEAVGNGGGGGALGWLLAPLAVLGLACRRRRACASL